MGRKTPEQEEVINNLDKFYNSREEDNNFFRDYAKMILDVGYKAKENKTTLDYCPIKSKHLLHVEKHKKLIQCQ